jgi:ribose 5-phosphate isomerase B
MKIAIGSDHAGFEYKERIKKWLIEKGHTIEDFGTDSEKSCDYPDFIRPAAQAVADGTCERGIVLGGSGNGEAIVSNRIKGIRCAIAWDLRSARLSRAHNDANVLSLGQRMMAVEAALEIVELWLATPFDGGRHLDRIKKIDA